MKRQVLACTMRASDRENMLQKFSRIIRTLDLSQGIKPKDLVAIKLHFGERGNTSFVRPIYVRQVVEAVTALGAYPFITDSNTLYAGTRANAVQHLRTAIENGFAFAVVGAPLTIADGLRGTSYAKVNINLEQIKTAYVGQDVVEADTLISVAHFKLHELAGFGGAIKNVGMGTAARRGKMAQHADISPKVSRKKCIGCGDCVTHCAQTAISLVTHEDKTKASLDSKKCIGCAECISICRQGAIEVQWNLDVPNLMKKMVEYAAAALKGKDGRTFFFNFLTQISPACDCHPSTDAAIVRDIGILASTDLVAIDQASIDLVNQEAALPGSCLAGGHGPGEDKVKAIYPFIDWAIQLEYAERLGLGSRDYELVWIDS